MSASRMKKNHHKSSIESGIYTIHRPSQCNIKFPKNNQPIHKKINNIYHGKEVVKVAQDGRWREIIVPSKDPTIYPAIWPKEKYENIKQKSKVISNEEKLKYVETKELDHRKKIQDIENRKFNLENSKLVQPKDEDESVCDIPKPNTSINTLKRSSELKSEALQGPRIANQIILASKCHAIRDVQLQEKALIKKEIEAEEKRLDILMEETRKAAIEEEEKRQNIFREQRIQNIQSIKQQIEEKEKLRLVELEKSKQEGKIIVHNAIISNEEYKAEQQKKKMESTRRLKELLDIGNMELQKNREIQREKEVVLNNRIEKFLKQRKEREINIKREMEALKSAQEREKFMMAQAQESEKKFHEEMENLRNLKIQEDVEREFRKKEKDAVLKKLQALETLQRAREKQISDIRSQIAVELAKDEQVYETVKQKLSEDTEKENKMKILRKQSIEAYRDKLLEQINQKEIIRRQIKEQLEKEGRELSIELQRKDEMEKNIIQNKIKELREQKVPEPYVIEVEQRLKKLKYY